MRVKRGVKARRRRNRLFERAKGFRGRSGNTTRQASSRVDKAMRYMYRDRKRKKGDLRALWITRINAAARICGLTYSKLTRNLKTVNVELDRKVLAQLGTEHPEAFKAVVEVANSANS